MSRILFTVALFALTLQFSASANPTSSDEGKAMRHLSYEERVNAQRLIELTLWRYRFEGSQHTFDEVMPEERLRSKVDLFLKQSALLEELGKIVSPEEVQKEMEWIAAHSIHYQALSEVWEALGNDPYLIAECYVRPLLVERLIREQYEARTKSKLEAQAGVEEFEVWMQQATPFIPPTLAHSYKYSLPAIQPAQSGSLISNGGFETGSFSPWQTNSGGGKGPFVIKLSSVARSGQYYALLGGDHNLDAQNIRQFFDVPSTAPSVTASFYLNITSEEVVSIQADTIEAVIVDTSGRIQSSLSKRSNLSKGSIGDYFFVGPFDLSSFKGRRIGLALIIDTDSSDKTEFRVDDVVVSTSGSSTPNFSLSVSPSTQTVQAGNTATYSLTLTSTGGFNSTVTVSFQNLPPNTRVDFNGGNSPVPFQVVTSPSTPAGTYTFTVVGTGGGLTRTTTAAIVVTTPLDFSLTISPTTQTVQAGGIANYSLIKTGNFDGNLAISFQNLPPGTTVPPFNSPSPMPFQLVTSLSTPPGAYSFTVIGTGGGLTRTATATIIVTPAGPTITSVTFDGVKVLTINGLRFGTAPRVLVNNTDRTARLKTITDTKLILKGKPSKLGIVSGANTIQVVDAQGGVSNLVTFQK